MNCCHWCDFKSEILYFHLYECEARERALRKGLTGNRLLPIEREGVVRRYHGPLIDGETPEEFDLKDDDG